MARKKSSAASTSNEVVISHDEIQLVLKYYRIPVQTKINEIDNKLEKYQPKSRLPFLSVLKTTISQDVDSLPDEIRLEAQRNYLGPHVVPYSRYLYRTKDGTVKRVSELNLGEYERVVQIAKTNALEILNYVRNLYERERPHSNTAYSIHTGENDPVDPVQTKFIVATKNGAGAIVHILWNAYICGILKNEPTSEFITSLFEPEASNDDFRQTLNSYLLRKKASFVERTTGTKIVSSPTRVRSDKFRELLKLCGILLESGNLKLLIDDLSDEWATRKRKVLSADRDDRT